MSEVNKTMNNLYSIIEIDGDEVLTETPLSIITEKDVLKYNVLFSKIVSMMETDSASLIRTLSTGFNSIIYNVYLDKFNEDKAYDKTKEFETFVNSLLLNTKMYYRGKEMTYSEYYALKNDKSIEVNMKFNICFFLSMFIVLSNTLNLPVVKGMTEVQKDICYIGSSNIGDFHSFVVNLRMENSSANASQA